MDDGVNEVDALLNENQRLIDVAEYKRLHDLGAFEGERVELIRGRVVRMGTMGPLHLWVLTQLTMVFTEVFRQVADVCIQMPLHASDDLMPQPDLMLIRKTAEPPSQLPKKAFLVVEVSQSSLRFDRVVKAPLYAERSSGENWVVNLNENNVEVYRRPKKGFYSERTVSSIATTSFARSRSRSSRSWYKTSCRRENTEVAPKDFEKCFAPRRTEITEVFLNNRAWSAGDNSK